MEVVVAMIEEVMKMMMARKSEMVMKIVMNMMMARKI